MYLCIYVSWGKMLLCIYVLMGVGEVLLCIYVLMGVVGRCYSVFM